LQKGNLAYSIEEMRLAIQKSNEPNSRVEKGELTELGVEEEHAQLME
jgi:hypothetical protein